MSNNAGWATLGIVPGFDRFPQLLNQGVNQHMTQAGNQGGQAYGQSFAQAGGQQAESGLRSQFDRLPSLGTLAGAATGLSLGAAFVETLGREKAVDRMSAALGADEATAGRLGSAAGAVFAGGYASSMEEAVGATEAIASSFQELQQEGGSALTDLTINASNFAAAMEMDVPRAATVAAVAVRSGLARDATNALDLMTAAMQKVPSALRENIADAVEEYAPYLADLGFEGEQAFALLAGGADRGAIGIDKIGDALKEFSIRATDMSTTSQAAYQAIGLDALEMSNQILAGGDSAQKATQRIVDGLLRIEDPSTRAAQAIALFGTPLEDLSVTDVPDFLRSLRPVPGALGEVEGATARLGDTLNDNAAARLESFKNKAQDTLVTFLGQHAVPAIERTVGMVSAIPGPVLAGAAAFGVLQLAAGSAFVTAVAGGAATAAAATASAFTGLRIRVMLASDAFIAARATAGPLTASLAAMRVGAQGAASRLGGLSALVGGPWGVAFLAATTAVLSFTSAQAKAREEAAALQSTLDDTGRVTEDTRRKMAELLAEPTNGGSSALEAAEKLGVNLALVTDAALGQSSAIEQLRGRYEELATASIQESGDLRYFEALQVAIEGRSGAIADARDNQRRLTEAIGETAVTQEETTASTHRYGDSLEAARLQLQQLVDAENEQRNSRLQSQRDAIALIEVLERVNETVNENGRAWNLSTEAGRENRSALLDLADQWNQSEASVQNVTGAYENMRDEFVRVALKMGATRTQAGELAAELLEIPNNPALVRFQTSGYQETLARVQRIANEMERSGGFWVASPGVGMRARAGGGKITGPGTSTSDSIPTALSNGEWVIKASSAAKYGDAFMAALNAGSVPTTGVATMGPAAGSSVSRGTDGASLVPVIADAVSSALGGVLGGMSVHVTVGINRETSAHIVTEGTAVIERRGQ